MADQPSAQKTSASVSFAQSRLARLKRRADFLRVANTRQKWATHGLILQVAPTRSENTDIETNTGTGTSRARVGFTASKKVGGAVERNRAKRRLRAIADEILPSEASRHCDYVLIGRPETIDRPFDSLRGDLRYALRKLKVNDSEAVFDPKAVTPTRPSRNKPHNKNAANKKRPS